MSQCAQCTYTQLVDLGLDFGLIVRPEHTFLNVSMYPLPIVHIWGSVCHCCKASRLARVVRRKWNVVMFQASHLSKCMSHTPTIINIVSVFWNVGPLHTRFGILVYRRVFDICIPCVYRLYRPHVLDPVGLQLGRNIHTYTCAFGDVNLAAAMYTVILWWRFRGLELVNWVVLQFASFPFWESSESDR